jgi:hypothetical protein
VLPWGLVFVAVAVVVVLILTRSSSETPIANARFNLYSNSGKLLGRCRALWDGSEELVADPQPDSREAELCAGRTETVLGWAVSKHPGAEARLQLYNEYNKLIANCRARRVGGELVADPQPGGREQALCAGAHSKENAGITSGQTAVYTYSDTGKLPAEASAERYWRIVDGRLVPCFNSSEHCVSARSLEAVTARHH